MLLSREAKLQAEARNNGGSRVRHNRQVFPKVCAAT